MPEKNMIVTKILEYAQDDAMETWELVFNKV